MNFKLCTEEKILLWIPTDSPYGTLSIQALLCVCTIEIQNIKQSPPSLNYSNAYSEDTEHFSTKSMYPVTSAYLQIQTQHANFITGKEAQVFFLLTFLICKKVKFLPHRHRNNSRILIWNKQNQGSLVPLFLTRGLPMSCVTSLQNYQVIISCG